MLSSRTLQISGTSIARRLICTPPPHPPPAKTNISAKHYHVSQWLGYCPHLPAHSYIRNMNYNPYVWRQEPLSAGSQFPLSAGQLCDTATAQLRKGEQGQVRVSRLDFLSKSRPSSASNLLTLICQRRWCGPRGMGDSIQCWGHTVRQ